MCGDSSRQSCGGAIAILNPPERATEALSSIERGLSGRLVFQSAGDDTLATDAIFTHDESVECSDGALYTIGIHFFSFSTAFSAAFFAFSAAFFSLRTRSRSSASRRARRFFWRIRSPSSAASTSGAVSQGVRPCIGCSNVLSSRLLLGPFDCCDWRVKFEAPAELLELDERLGCGEGEPRLDKVVVE
ncbi:hypothetical protein PG995_008284 [Apiospora arundinis]